MIPPYFESIGFNELVMAIINFYFFYGIFESGNSANPTNNIITKLRCVLLINRVDVMIDRNINFLVTSHFVLTPIYALKVLFCFNANLSKI